MGLAFYPMKTNPTWDRVEVMKSALKIKTDVDFYRLAGTDKSLGAQWKNGKVQMIGAEYAFKLQDETGFLARWIMLGEGPKRIDEKYQTILTALPLLPAAVTDGWHVLAKLEIEKSHQPKAKAA